VREIAGENVTFRPAKPVDQRRIQEHFYTLSKSDVVSRFFHEKTAFLEKDLKGVIQVDYVKDLTIIATVGDIGFARVIAVGESLLEESKNIAEVAFSVSKDWQGHGLGKILIQKLAQAARDNGISGVVAYTAPTNQGMIRLFKSLPYKVRNTLDGDILQLKCSFKEPIQA
jgi:GNAT superfamily N-acetyltransferase